MHGEAPAALAGLPDPDAVFVGGGGPTALSRPRRPAPGRGSWWPSPRWTGRRGAGRARRGAIAVEGVQLQARRLAPLPGEVHRLAATNPVFVLGP